MIARKVDDHALHLDFEEVDQELPLLDSVRSLVRKERELAGLQLEEKEREAECWRLRYLELQNSDYLQPKGHVRCRRRFPSHHPRRQQQQLGASTPSQPVDGGMFAKSYRGTPQSSTSPDTPLTTAFMEWPELEATEEERENGRPVRSIRRRGNLDLSGREMGAKELDENLSKMKWLRHIVSLDLSRNSLGDASQQQLRMLFNLKQLRCLDLRHNDLGPAAGASLVESLPRCKTLEVMHLEGNMTLASTPGLGAKIGTGIKTATKLGGCRRLWSLSVTLHDFECDHMASGEEHRRGAEQKDNRLGTYEKGGSNRRFIGRNDVGSRAAMAKEIARPGYREAPHPMNAYALVRALRQATSDLTETPRVRRRQWDEGREDRKTAVNHGDGDGRGIRIISLGLPYARLHPRTVAELATHTISSLTHIDLSFCFIGPAGASAIARALDGRSGDVKLTGKDSCLGRGADSLCSLQLRHNAIGDSGAQALCVALASNRCLTSLTLASNNIGPVGGKALASALVTDGAVLGRLDIGDNPLGEECVRLLVDAAAAVTAARSESGQPVGDAGCLEGVRVVGLERVPGVAVTTRESKARKESSERMLGIECDAVDVVVVNGVLPVHPEGDPDEDGFLQIFQIRLEESFGAWSDDRSAGTGRAGDDVLEVRWWHEGRESPSVPEGCDGAPSYPWRVCRRRMNDNDFVVKQGTGAECVPVGTSEDAGYGGMVCVLCNGWRKHDILKISMRAPSTLKCCGLRVRRLAVVSNYGLLWADADELIGRSSKKHEDLLDAIRSVEQLVVARQLDELMPSVMGGRNLHLMRRVYISFGGRIRASWWSTLAPPRTVEYSINRGEPAMSAHKDDTTEASAASHGSRGGLRQPEGYTWAIVKTRGSINSSHDQHGLSPCSSPTVVHHGIVPSARQLSRLREEEPSIRTHQPARSARASHGGRRPSTTTGNGDIDSSSAASLVRSCRVSSLLRWQMLESETAGWLPGDVLSLWVSVDDNRDSCPTRNPWLHGPSGDNSPRGVAHAQPFSVSVRGFELRAMDDAHSAEILRQIHPQGRECHAGCRAASDKPDHQRLSSNFPRPTRLDLATAYPMNMAAAGGSWT